MNNNTSTLEVFDFENRKIRFVGSPENPWWVAADICAVLEIKNTAQAVQKLDEDERYMFNIYRQGETWCVNESGLYNLIFRSRKAVAKRFRRWVTSEVLPQIRKTGTYSIAKSTTPRSLPSTEAIALATNKLIDRGLNKVQAGLFEFEQLSLFDSQNAPVWQAAKKELEPLTAMNQRLAAPKEIGQLLAQQQGLEKSISAVKINQMLEQAGLQYKKTRISKKSGKEKWDWALTEAGEEYGTYILTAARNSNGSVQPVRWYPAKIVDFLANHRTVKLKHPRSWRC